MTSIRIISVMLLLVLLLLAEPSPEDRPRAPNLASQAPVAPSGGPVIVQLRRACRDACRRLCLHHRLFVRRTPVAESVAWKEYCRYSCLHHLIFVRRIPVALSTRPVSAAAMQARAVLPAPP